MAITSSFANLATVTRASKKTDAGGWDFTNGGTVGTLTEYASGVAAIHPTAGLLVEEGSTNEVRNPRCEGSGARTYLPVHWQLYNLGGYTITKSDQADYDGWPSVSLQVAHAAPNNGSYTEVLFEERTSVGDGSTNMDGETWTGSVCVELVAGSLANIRQITLRIREFNAGLSSIGVTSSEILSAVDSSKRRFVASHTVDAGGVYLGFSLAVTANGVGAVDATFRISAPQLEEKAYPTSPILPEVSSPAATTRAADALGIADGAWSSSVASTWYIDAQMVQPQGLGATRYFAGGNGNARWLYYSGQGLSFYDGATIYAAPNSATLAAGDTIKGVSAFDASGVSIAADFSLSVGTGVAPNLSNLDPSTPGGVGLGATYGAAAAASFYLRDLRYWPRRLSDAELQALVGI